MFRLPLCHAISTPPPLCHAELSSAIYVIDDFSEFPRTVFLLKHSNVIASIDTRKRGTSVWYEVTASFKKECYRPSTLQKTQFAGLAQTRGENSKKKKSSIGHENNPDCSNRAKILEDKDLWLDNHRTPEIRSAPTSCNTQWGDDFSLKCGADAHCLSIPELQDHPFTGGPVTRVKTVENHSKNSAECPISDQNCCTHTVWITTMQQTDGRVRRSQLSTPWTAHGQKLSCTKNTSHQN